MQDYLQQIIKQRQEMHLYRTHFTHDGAQAPVITQNGKEILNFCSNDYLGFATHPQLKAAMKEGVEKYGVGSGASHLVCGHTQAHQQLEQQLAEFTGHERALIFSSGYMANFGVIAGLLSRHDAIFLDKLNHASLIDAAQLSRAKSYRYTHHDIDQLEFYLANSRETNKLIITDGVFSMDGELAKLPQMVELAKKYNAWIMLDDAHGLGVLGNNGRGTTEHYDLTAKDVPIIMGTLGKAFGISGAFIAGSALLIDALIQTARTYTYDTALPSALAYTLQQSVSMVAKATQQRSRLRELIQYFQQQARARNLPFSPSITPIQPMILGEPERALQVSEQLLQHNILVTAIRPPSVPQGSARLRISLSAAHREQEIDKLLNTLRDILNT